MQLEATNIAEARRRIVLGNCSALQCVEPPLGSIRERSDKLFDQIAIGPHECAPQSDLPRDCNRSLELVLDSFVKERRCAESGSDGKCWL